ncbi:MAG: hypothetical protein HYZ22_04605 [Chloroflexi bacterium]|nr:hypothetical protein [Chloroflexota bacterium]
MCIIVDANFASKIFKTPKDKDSVPVVRWLLRDGALVYGGRLAKELFVVEAARRSILELKRSGKAFQINDEEVDREEQIVLQMRICCSNDVHVVALARVSGARTLCSGDGDLHQDFKNNKLVNKPKGRVYQNDSHSELLIHTASCKKPK